MREREREREKGREGESKRVREICKRMARERKIVNDRDLRVKEREDVNSNKR